MSVAIASFFRSTVACCFYGSWIMLSLLWWSFPFPHWILTAKSCCRPRIPDELAVGWPWVSFSYLASSGQLPCPDGHTGTLEGYSYLSVRPLVVSTFGARRSIWFRSRGRWGLGSLSRLFGFESRLNSSYRQGRLGTPFGSAKFQLSEVDVCSWWFSFLCRLPTPWATHFIA
jgi:hypothetical protein